MIAGILTAMIEKKFVTNSPQETEDIGRKIGAWLKGGEVIELVSDLGGGKTTLTRGIAEGFGSPDSVASPSFTISYVYSRPDGKRLHHFDFYRLSDAGIVGAELAEIQQDEDSVVVVEWGDIIHDVLPKQRMIIDIKSMSATQRKLVCSAPKSYGYLFD